MLRSVGCHCTIESDEEKAEAGSRSLLLLSVKRLKSVSIYVDYFTVEVVMANEPIKNDLMHRYELHLDGKTALLVYELRNNDTVVFTHTFVPPELRGKNVAAILTRFALDDVRSQGKKVVPQCSYAAAFLERNKEYEELAVKP
jgi:predicted GNAT family acetyltransferase